MKTRFYAVAALALASCASPQTAFAPGPPQTGQPSQAHSAATHSKLLYASGLSSNTIYIYKAGQKDGAPIGTITDGVNIPYNVAIDKSG